MKPIFYHKNASWQLRGLWLLLGVLPLLAWDFSGGDLPLAHWYGSAQGFALQNDPLLAHWLHDGVRKAGWVLLLTLTVGIWLPFGPLRVLDRRDRGWMVGAIWLTLLVVVLLKGVSRTSCPWDVQPFGGTAAYVSHWNWLLADGGPGRCFPGGHASTAFAFLPLAWWLRPAHPRLGIGILCAVVLAGLALGWVQQMRGAHYLSHNLWTGWVCWASTWALHTLWQHRRFGPKAT